MPGLEELPKQHFEANSYTTPQSPKICTPVHIKFLKNVRKLLVVLIIRIFNFRTLRRVRIKF